MNKKGLVSSSVALAILGILLLVLISPILLYIKHIGDTSDNKMFKQYGLNPDDDFTPFDSSAHLSPEEKTVDNSINALICAVNSVANTYDDNTCGNEIKDTDVTCVEDEYQFGKTCVQCTNPIISIKSASDAADLVIKCKKDFKQGLLKQKFYEQMTSTSYMCGVMDTSSLSSIITKTDLDSAVILKSENVGVFYKLLNNIRLYNNEINKKDNKYCLLYNDNLINDDFQLSPCSMMGYNPSDFSCNIKAFELPQGNQKEALYYTKWLKDNKAPRYLLYYGAFTPSEEIIWESNYGRVSSGAYLQAAAIGGILGAFNSGAQGLKAGFEVLKPKSISKGFSNLKKTIIGFPDNFVSSVNALRSRGVRTAFDSFLKDMAEHGVMAAIRKQYTKEMLTAEKSEFKEAFEFAINMGRITREESEAIIKQIEDAALSNDINKIDEILTDLNKKFQTDGAKGGVKIRKELKNELKRNLENIETKKLAQLQIFRDYILKFRSGDELFEAFGKSIKNLEESSIDSNLRNKILQDIENNVILDPATTSRSLDRLFDGGQGVVPNEEINLIYDKFAEKLFNNYFTDEGVSSAVTNPETKNFLQALFENAKNSLPEGLAEAEKKYLLTKYLGGEIIYFMEMQEVGIVDRYESYGVNSINLGQPFVYGPKPISRNLESQNLLENYILLLGRKKSLNSDTPVRFYLASPCKTDLKIESTYCSCEVNNGAYLYKSNDNSKFLIENLPEMKGTLDNQVFLYDSLSDEDKRKVKLVGCDEYNGKCIERLTATEEQIRAYYFNYYVFDSKTIGSTNFVKSCPASLTSTIDVLEEFNQYKDSSDEKFRIKTRCIYVIPSNYAAYTNTEYPYNYCFTGDYSGSWRVFKTINDWGWTVVDVGATAFIGTLSLGVGAPFAYATASGMTAVAQTGIDGWIQGNQKWPQTKTSEDS